VPSRKDGHAGEEYVYRDVAIICLAYAISVSLGASEVRLVFFTEGLVGGSCIFGGVHGCQDWKSSPQEQARPLEVLIDELYDVYTRKPKLRLPAHTYTEACSRKLGFDSADTCWLIRFRVNTNRHTLWRFLVVAKMGCCTDRFYECIDADGNCNGSTNSGSPRATASVTSHVVSRRHDTEPQRRHGDNISDGAALAAALAVATAPAIPGDCVYAKRFHGQFGSSATSIGTSFLLREWIFPTWRQPGIRGISNVTGDPPWCAADDNGTGFCSWQHAGATDFRCKGDWPLPGANAASRGQVTTVCCCRSRPHVCAVWALYHCHSSGNLETNDNLCGIISPDSFDGHGATTDTSHSHNHGHQ
jgi:hypothetical protein